MSDEPTLEPINSKVTWPFGLGELTAALRRHLKAPNLTVQAVHPVSPPSTPFSVDIFRGIRVTVTGEDEHLAPTYDFLLKEPQGASRKGLAGVARREAGFYRFLASEIALNTPNLIASGRLGQWMIFEIAATSFAPQQWQAADFRQAVINMAALHDRFWQLGGDLVIYPWLGRPLSADFEVHLFAAASAFQHLIQDRYLMGLSNSLARLMALSSMLTQADKISANLLTAPETLIHGNYWPGVIGLQDDGVHVVDGWQRVSIGPGVLDLARFISESRWWLDNELPIEPDALIALYREQIANRTGHTWTDDEWQMLWDSALIWIFLQEWLELLVAIPDSLWDTRRGLIERVWFSPLLAAIHRQLNPVH